MSEETVIVLEDTSSSQADAESVARAAVSPSLFDAPEEKVVGERGEESPLGIGPEGPVEEGDVCEAEAGTGEEVDDEHADVGGGFDEVGVSGCDSEGFTFSEVRRRKRLARWNVSECVLDTTHLPQCECSNLQHLSLTFPLEFFCWPVSEFR